MAVRRHRSTLTSRADRRSGSNDQIDQVVIPFQRLTASEHLARDLRALVDAGLVIPVSEGAATRYAPAERGNEQAQWPSRLVRRL